MPEFPGADTTADNVVMTASFSLGSLKLSDSLTFCWMSLTALVTELLLGMPFRMLDIAGPALLNIEIKFVTDVGAPSVTTLLRTPSRFLHSSSFAGVPPDNNERSISW